MLLRDLTANEKNLEHANAAKNRAQRCVKNLFFVIFAVSGQQKSCVTRTVRVTCDTLRIPKLTCEIKQVIGCFGTIIGSLLLGRFC